jgi:hypothetical protein
MVCFFICYVGESNENRKTETKIRNIVQLSYKLALPPTRNKENEQGMASFFITKIPEVPDAAICREDYADSLLG